MTMTTLKLSKFGKKFLGTKKRSAYLIVTDKHTVQPSYWSEGSRTLTYALVMPDMSLRSLSEVGMGVAKSSPFDPRNDVIFPLTDKVAFVEMGHFCGKEATPAIIVKDAALVESLFV